MKGLHLGNTITRWPFPVWEWPWIIRTTNILGPPACIVFIISHSLTVQMQFSNYDSEGLLAQQHTCGSGKEVRLMPYKLTPVSLIPSGTAGGSNNSLLSPKPAVSKHVPLTEQGIHMKQTFTLYYRWKTAVVKLEFFYWSTHIHWCSHAVIVLN